LSTYKVPDLPSVPRVDVRFLEDADNPAAVMGSKAVGEPPFLYGIGTFFALLDAMRAHAPDKMFSYDAPLTNERVLTALGPGE
jgi:xanthine dehydrogenase large subunit